MKRIAVTQRVDISTQSGERRDALDQNWISFFEDLPCIPLILPNHLPSVKRILDHTEIHGILLTGGNDLVQYGGNAPERDEVELYLIEVAKTASIPLLGICRGMQLIQHVFKVHLQLIPNHVRQFHQIKLWGTEMRVNSYHRYGAFDTVSSLEVLARSEDAVIEAIAHKEHLITGVMWHPERDLPFTTENRLLVKKNLKL